MAALIVDDTALPKKGERSVGVAPQYAPALGRNANCQTLVSLTLASREGPIMVGLRLFLPESWMSDPARLSHAGVPQDFEAYRTKPEIALADAGYGLFVSFRQGLSERGLVWAVGIPLKQKVCRADVTMIVPVAGRGRPRKRQIPDTASAGAQAMPEEAPWQC